MRRLAVTALAVCALVIPGIGGVARASDVTVTLGAFKTDVAYAGFGGMRGVGTGTLTLAGVTGPITKALLYWQGPSFDSAAENAVVRFAGQSVTGTSLGSSADNCWGFPKSEAYRADVTALVSGDGTYALANFLKPGHADVSGVSLVVLYHDADPTNDRDLIFFAGNDSNVNNSFDANGWNVVLSGITYSTGSATLDMHVADGQSFQDDGLTLNGSTLVPAGAVFQGTTVPRGNGGPSNGGLWDIRSFDVTSALRPGDNTLNIQSGLLDDCLSLVLAVVNLPAGAAPGQARASGAGVSIHTPLPGGDVTYGTAKANVGESTETSAAVVPLPGGSANIARVSATSTSDGLAATATGSVQVGRVTISQGLITASAVQAVATATSHVLGAKPTSTKGSGIADLRLNGAPLIDDGTPNQRIVIPGVGTLTIRETFVQETATYASITLNMLHLVSDDRSVDVIIGSAAAIAGSGLPA